MCRRHTHVWFLALSGREAMMPAALSTSNAQVLVYDPLHPLGGQCSLRKDWLKPAPGKTQDERGMFPYASKQGLKEWWGVVKRTREPA